MVAKLVYLPTLIRSVTLILKHGYKKWYVSFLFVNDKIDEIHFCVWLETNLDTFSFRMESLSGGDKKMSSVMIKLPTSLPVCTDSFIQIAKNNCLLHSLC